MISSDSWLSRSRGIPFKNGASEVIPPFAIMAIESAALENQEVVLTCRKCVQDDIDNKAGAFVFNGETEIPDSSDAGGLAFLDLAVTAVGSGITQGQVCGPEAGSWELSSSGVGFWKLADVADSATDAILVKSGEGAVVAKHAVTPSGGIAAKSSSTMGSAVCTLQKCSSAGVLSNSGTTATIYNPSTDAIAGSTSIVYIMNSAGLRVAIVESCG